MKGLIIEPIAVQLTVTEFVPTPRGFLNPYESNACGFELYE